MIKSLMTDGELIPIIQFGKMPIANGFLTEDQIKSEYFFQLGIGFCPISKMVQLTELVEQEKMFHEEYAFYSSTSKFMQEHFKNLSQWVTNTYLKDSPDPFIVEIGSNDGIMLQNFKNAQMRHLGIEPSKNVAEVALSKGIKTISRFFDLNLAQEIVSEHGQADVFLGANVMCHIPYLHSVVEGIKALLKPRGVLVFEDPYLGDIIEKTSYDQIYDEHVYYFSVQSIHHLMSQHDLELIDVQPQTIHGGSMRYIVAHKGAYSVMPNVLKYLEKEHFLKMHEMDTFIQFKKNVEHSKKRLMEELLILKKNGKKVAGYGATSKSTTVTNYCNITPDLVQFISDTTPIKQNKMSPGVHIPIRSYEFFKENLPDVSLLFAWNHAEEIFYKEEAFRKKDGKWLVYVPNVNYLNR